MFDIPQDINDAAKGSLSGQSSAVPLPFAAPEMWWKNGETALGNVKEIKDARRFGGWGISKEELDNLSGPIPPLPSSWSFFELTNSKGKAYEAYLTRAAWVAPIARRYGWFEFEGKSASRVNYLCYLATFEQGGTSLNPWGPVVLSAKSYAGIDLDNAFKAFAAKTASIRKSTSANFFFTPLGTFGDEVRYQERTSKGGKSSSVTPCQLKEPKDGWTEDFLRSIFVGSVLAQQMMELKAQAAPWLDDWNKREKKSAPAPDVNAELAATDDDNPFN